MPYAAISSARLRAARARVRTSRRVSGRVGAELRRALRDQRVLLAREDRALLAHGDDDLAPGPEGVGHRAGVAHRDRRGPSAVANAEEQDVPLAAVTGHDLPGQLVGATGDGGRRELAGVLGVARGAEARVDERAGEDHGGTRREDEPGPSLAVAVHVRGDSSTRAMAHRALR